MNYCTKCGSLYAQPGTCNCFANAQPIRIVPTPQPQPWTPITPTTPQWPCPWWSTITVTANDCACNAGSFIAKAAQSMPPVKIGPS